MLQAFCDKIGMRLTRGQTNLYDLVIKRKILHQILKMLESNQFQFSEV